MGIDAGNWTGMPAWGRSSINRGKPSVLVIAIGRAGISKMLERVQQDVKFVHSGLVTR